MPLQIANPIVVDKVDRLARTLGTTKTAAVERAVDHLLSAPDAGSSERGHLARFVRQFDLVPDREAPFEAVEWDESGLPG